MGRALYSKYRSMSLKDIVGQDHVTDVLARALKKGRVAHAYLLTGPRGIGKTSIARILAHEITKLPYDGQEYLDIIEIDAASNNGVDDIRELRDKARITPVQSDKKVYIIDEVHMLSKAAFNALLKTLEEPPEHIVFILATTDVEKLPTTIVSRTQRFNLRRIKQADLVKQLSHIAKQESIDIESDALELLANYGDGSFRDAINLLDQLSSLEADGKISPADIRSHLGIATNDLVDAAIKAYLAADLQATVELINQVESSGASLVLFARQVLQTAIDSIQKQPQLLNLLDDLVAVESSARPEITLLVALSKTSAPAVPSAPSVAPTQPAPATPPVQTAAAPAPKKTVSTAVAEPAPVVSAEPVATAPKKPAPAAPAAQQPASQPTSPAPQTAIDMAKPSQDFPINDFAKQIKSDSAGLADLLAKSGYYYNGSDLVLYCGTKFRQSKLNTAKFRALFMAKVAAGNTVVDQLEILADKPPIKDPSLASVADLMGGGEMVDIT